MTNQPGDSKLRRTVRADSGDPCPRDGTAFLLIYRAVQQSSGLIHGRLDNEKGAHCAICWYFDAHRGSALPSALIDEVALVNDASPKATARQRKARVMKWLRWKLKKLGMEL